MKSRFLFFIILLLFSCKENDTAALSKEQIFQLKKYLTEKSVYSDKGRCLYVLLHPNFCGSCSVQIQDFVKSQFLGCNVENRVLILSSNKSEIAEKFSGIENLTIITDDENKLERYDLANGKEMFLFEIDGKLEKAGLIKLSTIDDSEFTLCK